MLEIVADMGYGRGGNSRLLAAPMSQSNPATLPACGAERRAILSVTCLAAFLFFNSFGSIGVALPAIQKQFGNRLSEIQWITLMGVVTISTLSFCFGRAGSRFGQRRLYKLGVALYEPVVLLLQGQAAGVVEIAPCYNLGVAPARIDPSSFFIGEHPVIQRVLALARRVAATDATVLITGESGTGKEVVARLIHSLSARAARPFVPVNCAAIPQELIESELFGHTRGAFTGAHAARSGMFQLSDNGTLFLDEIGEIPISLQPKLLRVLQDGAVKPVGADHGLAVNVRVVAATNKDLVKEIEVGAFREDLFYRLQVIPLHLPPLRARRSDIPLLIKHFLDRANRKYGLKTEIAPPAIVYLWEYDWPGNVRELENVIERLVVLCENSQIGLADLPGNIANFASDKKLPQPTLANKELDFRAALKQFERRLIDEAMRLADGNKAMAARMLKLKRTTLVAKLRNRRPGKDSEDERFWNGFFP